jgi:hypothetical protein
MHPAVTERSVVRLALTAVQAATLGSRPLVGVAHLGEKAGNAGVRYADPPAYLAHGHALCAKVANDGLHFRFDARSRKPFASRTRGHGRTITRTADSQASCVGNAGLHQIA